MTQAQILVAEDDPVFRHVIAFTLQQSGFGVDAVGDGQKAMSLLSSGTYDLMITDHQMPLCSGLELIEQIRGQDAYANLPIILCTARGMELDKEGLRLRYNLSEIMHKPFSPRMLADRARSLIESEEVCCGTR